jgi:hypothetical protein
LWRARPGAHVLQPVRLGLACGEVRISMVSPFLSSRCSGAMRPLILLPWQRVPDLGVHVKGEVDRGRALGQPLHVALRREDEDLVLVEVDLEELQEFLGRMVSCCSSSSWRNQPKC